MKGYLTIKCILSAIVATIYFPALQAQEIRQVKRTFYIARHAEKDTGSNAALSIIGQKRAGDLFRKLQDDRIDIILVSQYRRTGMTADSVRMYKQVDTLHYTADASGESISKIISTLPEKFKNILIIGHSNTVPAIIRAVGVKDYAVKELPDYEYDNLFMVQQFTDTSILKPVKFGEVSLPVKAPVKMNISQ